MTQALADLGMLIDAEGALIVSLLLVSVTIAVTLLMTAQTSGR